MDHEKREEWGTLYNTTTPRRETIVLANVKIQQVRYVSSDE